jgi:hypothetical protein
MISVEYSENQNCSLGLLRPPTKMLRPFAQKTSVKQCLLRRYDLPGGSPRHLRALRRRVPPPNLNMKIDLKWLPLPALTFSNLSKLETLCSGWKDRALTGQSQKERKATMNSNVPMKQETKPRVIAVQSPVLTGLSVEQRRPNACYHLPITCRNSTHLHLTHSHLRYNLSYRGESIPQKTAKNLIHSIHNDSIVPLPKSADPIRS